MHGSIAFALDRFCDAVLKNARRCVKPRLLAKNFYDKAAFLSVKDKTTTQ